MKMKFFDVTLPMVAGTVMQPFIRFVEYHRGARIQEIPTAPGASNIYKSVFWACVWIIATVISEFLFLIYRIFKFLLLLAYKSIQQTNTPQTTS
jgi:hypothetical protein